MGKKVRKLFSIIHPVSFKTRNEDDNLYTIHVQYINTIIFMYLSWSNAVNTQKG